MKNDKTDESIRKQNNDNYWFDIKSKPIQDNDPFLLWIYFLVLINHLKSFYNHDSFLFQTRE